VLQENAVTQRSVAFSVPMTPSFIKTYLLVLDKF